MYEDLQKEAYSNDLIVKEKKLVNNDGLIKWNRIAIRQNMLIKEKSCVLAEELGHYYTTYGDVDVYKRQDQHPDLLSGIEYRLSIYFLYLLYFVHLVICILIIWIMPFLHELLVIGIWFKHQPYIPPGLIRTGVVKTVESNGSVGHPKDTGILPGMVTVKRTF